MSKLWKADNGDDSRRKGGSAESKGGAVGGKDAAGNTTAGSLEKRVEAFTVGNDIELDQVLLPYDLEASSVHLEQLRKAGLVSDEEAESLQGGLAEIGELHGDGRFEILAEHEDGHTAIEVWLTERFGGVGGKIHTGRSRNDQVLTAMRLFEKDRLGEVLELAGKFAGRLLDKAEEGRRLPMPGYTHTRKAMLSSGGQWLAGYAELIILQMEASSGIRELTDRSPLGTAAGFGTTIDLDRDEEADALGFIRPLISAASAQLSRGWVEMQLVQYLSGITSLLARLADDIIQYSSEAYGLIDLDPAVCTGSSIMPNKKNPDLAELVRGKNALMQGHEATLRGIIQQIGSGYHRDLQLTKEPVIRAFELTESLLEASSILVDAIQWNEKAMREACTPEMMAAEEANRLVKEQGYSFREAYRKVKGQLQEGTFDIDPDARLEGYTQLGSPGNPGLDRLRKML